MDQGRRDRRWSEGERERERERRESENITSGEQAEWREKNWTDKERNT